MRPVTSVLAILAFVGFVLTAAAEQENPSRLYGKVISVDTAGGKVVIAPKHGPHVTVTTDASTKVQVDGKDATLGDINPDMTLRVSPASGMKRDFSRPVVYTVTAADGTTQGYSVSVMPPARGQLMRVSGESLVLPAGQAARLSFDRLSLGSVAVRSTYQAGDHDRIDYQEGADYTVDYLNGTITRTGLSGHFPVWACAAGRTAASASHQMA